MQILILRLISADLIDQSINLSGSGVDLEKKKINWQRTTYASEFLSVTTCFPPLYYVIVNLIYGGFGRLNIQTRKMRNIVRGDRTFEL